MECLGGVFMGGNCSIITGPWCFFESFYFLLKFQDCREDLYLMLIFSRHNDQHVRVHTKKIHDSLYTKNNLIYEGT